MKYFLCVALVAVIDVAYSAQVMQCNEYKGEIFSSCHSPCPKTCENKDQNTSCMANCSVGCGCPEGTVRRMDGVCVNPIECPVIQCDTNKGEVFSSCHSACPKTCENKDQNTVCTTKCVPGCGCVVGTVRRMDGICVHPHQCPVSQCNTNKGEVFSLCHSPCPKTCENKNQNTSCMINCVVGCGCPEGTVRRIDGVCVQPHQCPVSQCDTNKGEVFSSCLSPCPKTCENKDQNTSCVANCMVGCGCPEGTVKRMDGVCVYPHQCPVIQCDTNKGEVFSSCHSACPKTCENKDQNSTCTLNCVVGCGCPEGTVRRIDGVCISPQQCSVSQCDTSKGEVFSSCHSACPKTCENKDQITVCTTKCVAGCGCLEETVRRMDGVCVHPHQCSVSQ